MCEYCRTAPRRAAPPPVANRPGEVLRVTRPAPPRPPPRAAAADGAPRPLGTVLLVAGCGLLVLSPLALTRPPAPAPALPPPHVVADRLERTYGAGRPVELRAVPARTRLEARTGVGEVRTLAYRCDAPGDVRAVAVTDLTGEVVHQPLPTDADDGATPALLCDGNPHEVRVLLVVTGDPEVVPSDGPSRMLMMTRVM